jgi:hypothetical protein
MYGDKWYLVDGSKVQVLAKALKTHLRELTNQIVSVFYVPVNREVCAVCMCVYMCGMCVRYVCAYVCAVCMCGIYDCMCGK